MSIHYLPPESFSRLEGLENLTVYNWGDDMVNSFFCKTCGIYTFHEAKAKPGNYRINLGCVAGIDPLALEIDLIDGKNF